ncbi:MAG: hypothetical protein GF308_15890 [Candidatus Heimdallarchaeota archaeon]|nr:hypothetical protein [Candidatus Heimdallarchaeota archaeon]
MNESDRIVGSSNEDTVSQEAARYQVLDRIKEISVTEIIHQIIALGLIHILYIIFELYNAFLENWISAIIYGVLSLGTLVFVWFQWTSAKYLIPIPFISLVIVGAFLEFPIFITILFALYCIFYFAIVFIKGEPIDANITIVCSGLSFLLLTIYMLFGQGFVQIGFEFNIVVGMLILWTVAASAVVIIHRESLLTIGIYNSLLMIICSISPFIRPEGTESNIFILVCGLIFLITTVLSLTLIFKHEDINFGKLVPFVFLYEIGLIIYSYSFNLNFAWLSSNIKAIIVHYGFFIPVLIYIIVNLAMLYSGSMVGSEEESSYEMRFRNDQFQDDGSALIVLLSFIITSLAMFGWSVSNLNLINALVVSVIFFGLSFFADMRITTSSTLVFIHLFLGLLLAFVANLEYQLILIILMALSGITIIFALINEKFLTQEPLTTTMTIIGSVILMVTLLLYFGYLSLWISLGWALIGLYSFTVGVLMEKIFLRRAGLVIIIIDVVKSIFDVVRLQPRWLMGLGFIILAITLFACIFLFRWSEKHQERQAQSEN